MCAAGGPARRPRGELEVSEHEKTTVPPPRCGARGVPGGPGARERETEVSESEKTTVTESTPVPRSEPASSEAEVSGSENATEVSSARG